jgi:hypothetical protein
MTRVEVDEQEELVPSVDATRYMQGVMDWLRAHWTISWTWWMDVPSEWTTRINRSRLLSYPPVPRHVPHTTPYMQVQLYAWMAACALWIAHAVTVIDTLAWLGFPLFVCGVL